jgi:hypothetical protein
MLIVGYSRSVPALGSGVALTALPPLANTASASPYVWTQDVSSVPSGARCLLVTWARDTDPLATQAGLAASVGDAPAELVKLAHADAVRVVTVAIHGWTKASETSVDFSASYSQAMSAGGFQLFFLENAHASAVADTKTGSSLVSATCSLSAPLSTAPGGVALVAAAGGANSTSNSGTWSAPPDHETDQTVEAFLRVHAATYQTDGSPLDPTLTISQTNNQTAMVAVSIPPA